MLFFVVSTGLSFAYNTINKKRYKFCNRLGSTHRPKK